MALAGTSDAREREVSFKAKFLNLKIGNDLGAPQGFEPRTNRL